MNRNQINGKDFEGMLANAFNNILNREQEINSMNVFPVADGDTGTNMRLTVQHGLNAPSNMHLGFYLQGVAKEMLLGARGNSGVILSQLFAGMAKSLRNHSFAFPGEMRNAFIYGYRTAYKAVINPVEGTILTVSRLGIENVRRMIAGRISMEEAFKLYIDEMNKVLLETPEMLSVLKESNVLDSGAKGYILIIEGMYKYLLGEHIEKSDEISEVKIEKPAKVASFDENSEFLDGYCMEFHLQLMNSKNYKTTFSYNNFVKEIGEFGNSLVTVRNDSIIKVHIHTLTPSKVIDLAQRFGEFISFKLENMQLQHNEFSLGKEIEDIIAKEFAIIACVDGEGVASTFKEMGADYIVSGGQSMNPSVSDFVEAIKHIKAETIVIYPNNSNIIETANQAKKAFKNYHIEIIPTTSIMEGYYSLAMDIPDGDKESRLSSLKDGMENIITVSLSKAVKDYKDIKKGEYICCVNDKVVSGGTSPIDVLLNGLKKIKDLSSRSGAVIFKGKDNGLLDEDIESLFNDHFSNLEINILDGNQGVYELLIGII